MKKIITEDVIRFGISAYLKGCFYLRTAIECAVKMEKLSMGKVYAEVAEVYSTAPSAVERAIRYAIGAAWDRDTPGLHDTFPEKPVNSKLIAYVVKGERERGIYNSFSGASVVVSFLT